MFLFLSLAMVKRYGELITLTPKPGDQLLRRGYTAADIETLSTLGAASGFASVLVLALYVNSPSVESLYQTPEAMWLICPLVLYWLNRMWIGARRGKIDDDPVIFALKDSVSRIILLLVTALVLIATLVDSVCLPWSETCG